MPTRNANAQCRLPERCVLLLFTIHLQLGSANAQSKNTQSSLVFYHDAQLRAPLCNVVGLHALTMWRGGDAHFHCNLTRRTGVVGGATPAVESTQWPIQARLRELKKSKDRLSVISSSSSGLWRSNAQGTGTWQPTRRPWVTSHQSEKDFLSAYI